MFNLDLLLEDLKWAPSAHNVQPLRLKRIYDLEFETCSVPSRHLPVADPHKKDLEMSCGAFMEGIRLSLSKQGYEIASEQIKAADVVHFSIQKSAKEKDSLSDYVTERFSYRGKFEKPSVDQIERIHRLESSSNMTSPLKFTDDREVKNKIAKKYDEVNLKFLVKPGYIEELYSWLRFSAKHPQWSKDGLNSEAIALKGVEAFGASVIMKPGVFHFCRKLGLLGLLITEAPQVNSAHSLVAIKAPSNSSYYEQGKIFYRAWLQLTKLGLYGAPLSLLTDDEASVNLVKSEFDFINETLVNILRVGFLPKNYVRYRPARLNGKELLISQ